MQKKKKKKKKKKYCAVTPCYCSMRLGALSKWRTNGQGANGAIAVSGQISTSSVVS